MANTIVWTVQTRIIIAVGYFQFHNLLWNFRKIKFPTGFHYYPSFIWLRIAAYAESCQHFTNSCGNFSSLTFPKPANEIDSERDFDAARKTTVLISVSHSHNHQIWLAFEKCITFEKQHFVNFLTYIVIFQLNCWQIKASSLLYVPNNVFQLFQIYDGLTRPVLCFYRTLGQWSHSL